ncbi:polysaccharide deacetylase family protein [Echinicola vietnamensis]|uniref:Putative xylanase/chitin deacetylase n=1 Tax=Echinicola vietnamensis (strain DSM 17526 / LMG 23754 / KMM 6221) TaxID=926556 RepID=L0FUM3_ECHVK|nr:polysaccharide deacetylase family protein [Echinicola vietnamensis]AGA76380.1 putative xylanase/chitin deacetylase [Echinicola vietnamensis DSM 17526]
MVVHHVPKIVKWIFPKLTWNRSRQSPTIYLTFDDGPVPGVTDFVLDELAKWQIKATFFCVGDNVRKHPDLAKRIIKEGHQIGNHTYHHLNGSKTENVHYYQNVGKCSDTIFEVTGNYPTLFRPPYGRIKGKQAAFLGNDYEVVMWDVLSGDYDQGQSPETCLQKTIQYTQNGSIVLFHDQQKTAEVIKKVLPEYLRFVREKKLQAELL